jgi:hypothetical protein
MFSFRLDHIPQCNVTLKRSELFLFSFFPFLLSLSLPVHFRQYVYHYKDSKKIWKVQMLLLSSEDF